MDTIGSHIRKHRKSKKWKLKHLSEKSGLSIPYLSDIERDVVNPSLTTLQSIAKALEITLPEIVDFDGSLEHKLLAENQRLTLIIREIHSLSSRF